MWFDEDDDDSDLSAIELFGPSEDDYIEIKVKDFNYNNSPGLFDLQGRLLGFEYWLGNNSDESTITIRKIYPRTDRNSCESIEISPPLANPAGLLIRLEIDKTLSASTP